ncbi:hypothetical protein [Kitasatospora sp. LaBMicrA B282]|uniref:hypothetical protein n=1 Tax=Kitasatospora sp. LaBMicrA B282 TaxID=3420949 RepID=UPI003D0E44CC
MTAAGTVTPTTTSQVQGADFTVAFSTTAATASGSNWIVMVPAGATPASGNYTHWEYTPSAASGTVTLDRGTMPAPGNWDIYLLANGGYTPLSAPAHVTVTPAGTVAPTTSTVTKGSPITVTFSTTAATASSSNWIAMVPAGATPTSNNYTQWEYTPSPASGTVTLDRGNAAAPGNYDIYLLANQGYTPLSAPAHITVQ